MSVDTTTFPARTSFATGKDSGSHGVYDMLTQSSDYSTQSVKTTTDDPAICDFLNDGLFINHPASTDIIPQGEDTYVVSAFDAKNKETAIPDDLKSLDAYDDYVLSHDPKLKTTPKHYLQHILDISEARWVFAAEAFEAHDPDVRFILFSTPDWAGHLLGTLNMETQRKEFYTKLLTHVDEWAGRLAERAENVVLMSDRGFEQKNNTSHIADWLRDEGYLVETESDGLPSASEITVDVATSIAKRSDQLYGTMRRVHNRILGLDRGASLQTATRLGLRAVDCVATLVHNSVSQRQPVDSPTVEDPEPLRTEIKERLESLTNEDGEPIFRDILLPEESYVKPDADVHDIIARPAPGNHPLRAWSPIGGVTSPTTSFEHQYWGIFIADGPMFRDGTIEGMNIIDVLPTVMTALGQPVSPEFNGETMKNVLADSADLMVRSADEMPTVRRTVMTTRSEGRSSRNDSPIWVIWNDRRRPAGRNTDRSSLGNRRTR